MCVCFTSQSQGGILTAMRVCDAVAGPAGVYCGILKLLTPARKTNKKILQMQSEKEGDTQSTNIKACKSQQKPKPD